MKQRSASINGSRPANRLAESFTLGHDFDALAGDNQVRTFISFTTDMLHHKSGSGQKSR